MPFRAAPDRGKKGAFFPEPDLNDLSHPRPLEPADLDEALALIRAEFAYMDGVIDPPSSMHRLSRGDLAAGPGQVWVTGRPVIACVVLTAKEDCLYIGKLAVSRTMRGRGLARVLIATAEEQARLAGLDWLELQTRIELTDNQRIFLAMGFAEVARTAHAGYDRPTSITFRRRVGARG
jgi:GNAT superfamily N-acetyltransferase